MVKRVYIETVKKYLIGAGITVGTLIGGIFLYLNLLGVIEITGYSGDMVCAGTLEDPCYAYINLTAKEDIFIYPVGYDPWGRDTIMQFDPAVKSWKLQRSWGKGWRDIPLNETCTGTWCGAPNNKGVKYSYVLREGRDYQFRIVGYKNNPYEDIKWAVNYKDKEYLDPVWKGKKGINYKNNNMTIEFKEGSNFLGQIVLKSHKFYDEEKEVVIGKNKTVIWYEIDFNESYVDVLGEVEFIDMRQVIVNDSKNYKEGDKPEIILNPNYLLPVEKNYSFVFLDEGKWLPYNSLEIPKEKMVIGVQTDLSWGENIDVVLNVFGNKLNRHAVVVGVSAGFVSSSPSADPSGSYNWNVDRNAIAAKFTSSPGAAKITEIGWWCGTASTAANYELAVYEDIGEVYPGAILHVDRTNAKGTTAGWKKVAVDWAISENTIYWFGLQLDNTATTYVDGTNEAGNNYVTRYTQDTLPDPWGVDSAGNDRITAIYAVWEAAPDETSPYFTDGTPTNQTLDNETALAYDINATDAIGFSCFAVNDTTNFKINCSGYLENNTQLSVKLYNLNITINDTSNNLNSTTMWVNVTAYAPPVDTCTCPGAGNNWEVDMEDYCNLTTVCTLTTGNLTWIGSSGYFNCSANLNLTNRDAPPSSTTFYHSSGCEIIYLIFLIVVSSTIFRRRKYGK